MCKTIVTIPLTETDEEKKQHNITEHNYLSIASNWHEAETKLPPFCRWQFQIHFLEWMNFNWHFTGLFLITNISALVQIMAWCRPNTKPLSNPIIFGLLMANAYIYTYVCVCVTQPQWVKKKQYCLDMVLILISLLIIIWNVLTLYISKIFITELCFTRQTINYSHLNPKCIFQHEYNAFFTYRISHGWLNSRHLEPISAA